MDISWFNYCTSHFASLSTSLPYIKYAVLHFFFVTQAFSKLITLITLETGKHVGKYRKHQWLLHCQCLIFMTDRMWCVQKGWCYGAQKCLCKFLPHFTWWLNQAQSVWFLHKSPWLLASENWTLHFLTHLVLNIGYFLHSHSKWPLNPSLQSQNRFSVSSQYSCLFFHVVLLFFSYSGYPGLQLQYRVDPHVPQARRTRLVPAIPGAPLPTDWCLGQWILNADWLSCCGAEGKMTHIYIERERERYLKNICLLFKSSYNFNQ